MKRVAPEEPKITAFRTWFTGESEDVDRDFLIGRYHAVEHSLKAISLFFLGREVDNSVEKSLSPSRTISALILGGELDTNSSKPSAKPVGHRA